MRLGSDSDEFGQAFRALPSTLPEIESNFALGNVDWKDHVALLDEDGVFHKVGS
ncbi:hypothetical protein FAIPA1_40297 [Frankia sp. AiPs1]|uniref:DUF6924 domain-containing protein n=1 Tax=Frankia sp. AiPa1 TaxID=573492 RepID=UPI00202B6569|nr:hypothetical protein [Frankia sp. AiPa1]MCL9761261.1 hypothetical protein [Frankia sp. AiPa1]